MATYKKIEFDVGATIYGQPVRLVGTTDGAGRNVWQIHRDEGNQRDDHVWIDGLTPATIRKMAEVMDTLKLR